MSVAALDASARCICPTLSSVTMKYVETIFLSH